LEQFYKMPPAERERELAKLPADKREKIQQQLERYDRLTPEQKQQVDRFNQLPPDVQNAFRKAYQRLQKQAPGRQDVMREELNRLRAMTPAERASRLKSSEFASQFNKNERQILGDLAAVFPN
jgi:hypothetical protein